MPKVKVVFNRELCIGTGICVAVAPKFWKLAENGKAVLLGSKQNPKNGKDELVTEVSQGDLADLRTAKDSCPAQVIELIEEK